MRKRTVKCVADTIFWYVLYFLPVVVYLLYILAEPSTGTISVVSMESLFSSVGLGIVTDNAIITALSSIFGTGGIFPLFSTLTPFIIFTWFISTYIIHLAVDFLLFIPRFCHKWMDAFVKE